MAQPPTPTPPTPPAPTAAIVIGSLDGVHRGHAALLAGARGVVGARGRVVAMVFDPHPLSALNPALVPARLTTWPQRERLLHDVGADQVVRLEPSPALLGQSPLQFVQGVVERFHPVAFVEGPDFHFGKARAGDNRLLGLLGQEMGFATIVIDAVEAALTDHSIVRCSSSMARWLVQRGRMNDAAMVLGRPYELEGVVVQGDRRGRTIGFPTANLKTDQLLPADGVYAACAVLPDGAHAPAALNVGERPTFNGVERRVEAHLLLDHAPAAWSTLPGVPEYGWTLRLQVIAFLRDQYRFESASALTAQVARDCERARRVVLEQQATYEPPPRAVCTNHTVDARAAVTV